MKSNTTHRPPRIYLAGKIALNDWRHDLVLNLRGHDYEDGPIDCGLFTYIGPFFIACDHGCRHGPGLHGVAGWGCDGELVKRSEVFDRNQAALAKADLVFAYIDAPECYGTAAEIGWAYANRTSVELHFSPQVNPDDFWYLTQMSGGFARRGVARDQLKARFADAINIWSRQWA
jgi:hypothetical protein